MKNGKEITIKRLDGSLYRTTDYFFESDRKAYLMHTSVNGINTTFEFELKWKPPLSFKNMDKLLTSGWIDLKEGYDYTDDDGVDQTHLELHLNAAFRPAVRQWLDEMNRLGYDSPLSAEEQQAIVARQASRITLLNLLGEHCRSVYMAEEDRILLERCKEINHTTTCFFAGCEAGLTPEVKREIECRLPLMADTGRQVSGKTGDKEAVDQLLGEIADNPLLSRLDIDRLLALDDPVLHKTLSTYRSLLGWLTDLQARLKEYPLPKTWLQIGDTEYLVNRTGIDIQLVETGSLFWKKWYVEIKSRRSDGQVFDFKTFRYRPFGCRLQADPTENKEKVGQAIVWNISRFRAVVAPSGYRFQISSAQP